MECKAGPSEVAELYPHNKISIFQLLHMGRGATQKFLDREISRSRKCPDLEISTLQLCTRGRDITCKFLDLELSRTGNFHLPTLYMGEGNMKISGIWKFSDWEISECNAKLEGRNFARRGGGG